jgi:hypothetical protein
MDVRRGTSTPPHTLATPSSGHPLG